MLRLQIQLQGKLLPMDRWTVKQAKSGAQAVSGLYTPENVEALKPFI